MPRRVDKDGLLVASLNGRARYHACHHTTHEDAVAELVAIATTEQRDPFRGIIRTLRTDLLAEAASLDLGAWRHSPETHPFSENIVDLLMAAGADPDLTEAKAQRVHQTLEASRPMNPWDAPTKP